MCLPGRPTSRGKEPASDEAKSKLLREDEVLRSKLEEAAKHVPRYLFRMWHQNSGGDPKLNTAEKITPLAFLKGMGHQSMYDMSVEDLLDNTTQHLFEYHVDTEFSSWSASPRFVLHYATCERESAYVAVIDTLGLRESTGNSMFHVPALAPIFEDLKSGHRPDYGLYDWEYLVHGVIEGRHYKAASFQSLCDAGLTNHLPALEQYVNAWGSDKFPLPNPIVMFSREEMEDLSRMASLFEPQSQMCAAITITLFCCKKRAGFGTELKEDELREIVDCLGGRNHVPEDWCASFSNDVYDLRYGDNRQMVNVMRAVSAYCWGMGARARFAK